MKFERRWKCCGKEICDIVTGGSVTCDSMTCDSMLCDIMTSGIVT